MNIFDKKTFETTNLNRYIKFYNIEMIPESDKGNFVYMFVDKEDQILYVGKTKNIKSRVDTHLREIKKDNWNKRIHKVFFLENISTADMNTIESYMIGLLDPIYNSDGKTITNHTFNIEIPIFSQVSLEHHYNLFFATSRDINFIRGNKISFQKFLAKKASFMINYDPFSGNNVDDSNMLITKYFHNPFSTPNDIAEKLFVSLLEDGMNDSSWQLQKNKEYLYTKIEMVNYTAETLYNIREHFSSDMNTEKVFKCKIKETDEILFTVRPFEYFSSFYIYFNISTYLTYFEGKKIIQKGHYYNFSKKTF